MKIEDKKIVYDYMGWLTRPFFDSNDMIALKDKMVEKGDWSDFDYYVFYNLYSGADYCVYTSWLFTPERFFELFIKCSRKTV